MAGRKVTFKNLYPGDYKELCLSEGCGACLLISSAMQGPVHNALCVQDEMF